MWGAALIFPQAVRAEGMLHDRLLVTRILLVSVSNSEERFSKITNKMSRFNSLVFVINIGHFIKFLFCFINCTLSLTGAHLQSINEWIDECKKLRQSRSRSASCRFLREWKNRPPQVDQDVWIAQINKLVFVETNVRKTEKSFAPISKMRISSPWLASRKQKYKHG